MQEYLERIYLLGDNYLKSCENFQKDRIELYKKQILIEKNRINHQGVDYDGNGNIKNIEKMLAIICRIDV